MKLATIVCAFATLVASVAHAQAPSSNCAAAVSEMKWSPTLQVKVVRAESRRAAIMSGVIGPQDVILPAGISEVWLHSPGGDYAAAARLAERLREQRIRARVPANWICGDACAVLFASSAQGKADPGSILYISPIRRGVREPVATPAVSLDATGAALFKTAWGAEAEEAAAAVTALRITRFPKVTGTVLSQNVNRVRSGAAAQMTIANYAMLPGFACTTAGDEAWRPGVREPFVVMSLSGRYPPPGTERAFVVRAPAMSLADLQAQWPRAHGELLANERRNNGLNQRIETNAATLMAEGVAQARSLPSDASAESLRDLSTLLTTMSQTLTAENFRITLLNQPLSESAYLSSLKAALDGAGSIAVTQRNAGIVGRDAELDAALSAARDRATLAAATDTVLGIHISAFCPDMLPFADGEPRPRVSEPPGFPAATSAKVHARCKELRNRERFSERERNLMNSAGEIVVRPGYGAPTAAEVARVFFREFLTVSTAEMVEFNIAFNSGINEFSRDVSTSLAVVGQRGPGRVDPTAGGYLTELRGVDVKSCAPVQGGGYQCTYGLDVRTTPNRQLQALDRLGVFTRLLSAANAQMPVQMSNRFVLTKTGWRSPDLRAKMQEGRDRSAMSFYEGLGQSARSTMRMHCAMREAANDVWVQADPNCQR